MAIEGEQIIERDIEKEMRTAYIDYAMSVIVSRALPDVRDGLKPVHRRILYAMHEDGITSDKPYRKCANTVGSVLGRYHPHGDASVYDAMVRMAQDFSMRYMLIDGHGNFGSVDGDPAAAMRYTEARMAKISNYMMADIEKNTVSFMPNYDDRLQEPTVLPAQIPALLINGSSGIAVGMATNIPPHNLTEVIDGIIKIIDEDEVTDEQLEVNNQIGQLSIALSKAILAGKKTEKIKADLEVVKQKKEKLLKNRNLPIDFFSPHYTCSQCQDTGYLISNNQIMCTCLRQKLLDYAYNQSNISSLDVQNFDHFSLNVFSDKVDKNKYGSELSPRQNIQKIKQIAENFISHFDDSEEKNLLFTGNTGLGKTYLTNCIAAEILKQGKTVLYQTAPVMLDAIIDFKFGKNPNFHYQDLLNVDLLIIDDLGTENSNNIKLSELFNILNTRLLNQNHHITKTIISTNLSLNNLFKAYDERIFSRLVGYYNVCRFFGEDLRYANKKLIK